MMEVLVVMLTTKDPVGLRLVDSPVVNAVLADLDPWQGVPFCILISESPLS